MSSLFIRRVLPVAVLLVYAAPAPAVILYSSATRNIHPPGSLLNNGNNHGPHGDADPRRLLNSGWQWQGQFANPDGMYLGTAIAPQFFLTAAHIGNVPSILLNGATYNIDTTFNGMGWIDDPNSDLRIWKITGTFPSFAPLYTEPLGSEVGRPLVVFGRGTQRGAEVRVGGELKGWQWGAIDGVQSWGENVVSSVVNSQFGPLLYFTFDRDGGPNEAALSDKDSSGGLFVQSGGQWKLAGVNIAVDGPWRFDQAGAPFNAAIFDAGGLWVGSTPQFIPDGAIDVPAGSYSTSISGNLVWIQSVVGSSIVPEPSVGLMLIGLVPLLRRIRR